MPSILSMTSHGGVNYRSVSDSDKTKLSCISCYTSMFRNKLDEQSFPLAVLFNIDNEDEEIMLDAFLSVKLTKEKNKIKININATHLGKEILSKDIDHDFNYSTFISELENEALYKISKVVTSYIQKFDEYRSTHLS